jgi:ribonuclease G
MVNYELVVNSTPGEIIIALLREKKLVELHREKGNSEFGVGDIYYGRVKKVMQGLNAAFVDVGHEKDAFLHYLDLGPQVNSLMKYTQDVKNGKANSSGLMYFKPLPDIDKNGKISDVIKPGTDVLIQVAKEPISSKGPRISSEISLAGRYLVLVPFSDRISVSQKIKVQKEKVRLKEMMMEIKPKNFGVIVRTVAENVSTAELQADLKDLMKRWDTIYHQLKVATPPAKILSELDRTSAFLRDMLNPTYSNVVTNDETIYNDLKSYIAGIAPESQDIVKLHQGKYSLFMQYDIDKQIKALFGRTVNMKSGAYLIIEKTEALHVIDVNSGNRAKSDKTQETNALETNLEAAEEIARQLRLRDMGGIIVIDFIDMSNADNKKVLYQALRDFMAEDKAKHTILPPTKFGLVQITRERVRPEVEVKTTEKCPVCDGTGEAEASILIADLIDNRVKQLLKEKTETSIYISTHPYIAAFLTKGIFKSLQWKWFFEFKVWVKVKPDTAYHFLEFHIFNKNQEEIYF